MVRNVGLRRWTPNPTYGGAYSLSGEAGSFFELCGRVRRWSVKKIYEFQPLKFFPVALNQLLPRVSVRTGR